MYTVSNGPAQLPFFPLSTGWGRCSCSFFPSSIANVWITIGYSYFFNVMIIFKVFVVMIAHSLVSGKTWSVSVRLGARWAFVLLYYWFSSAVMLYKITMPAKDLFTLGAWPSFFFMNILAVSLYHLSRRKHFTTLRTRILPSFVHVKVVSFCITFLRKTFIASRVFAWNAGGRPFFRHLRQYRRCYHASEMRFIYMPCSRDIRTWRFLKPWWAQKYGDKMMMWGWFSFIIISAIILL